jgi:hypothetical protein
MAPKASAKPMASAKASAKPMTSMAPKASAKASSAFQKEEEKDKNEKKQKMPGANMKAKKEKKHQKEEKDKNEKKQKMQGANMQAKKEKKQEKKQQKRQTLVQIQTLIEENELDFSWIDPNPERQRPALLTPSGITDDEPPIGERRFGKNRVTFSQSRMLLGDLGCSKCNGGTIPSGSGCTTCRRKLGWVPADATKKHWVPAGLIADDDKHW